MTVLLGLLIFFGPTLLLVIFDIGGWQKATRELIEKQRKEGLFDRPLPKLSELPYDGFLEDKLEPYDL